MKNKSPKQSRIDKKKPRSLTPGVYIVETDSSFVVHGSKVDKLPPFDEYNPRRIHVARRRRAWKEHTTFPRGWTIVDESADEFIGDGFTSSATTALWHRR